MFSSDLICRTDKNRKVYNDILLIAKNNEIKEI